MKLIIKQFFFYLMLLGYLNLNAQNTECTVFTFANDLTASNTEFKTLIKEPNNFKAWLLLNKESPNLRTNIDEIKLVSKNLDEITKVGYTAQKKVSKAGSLSEDIINQVNDALGTFYSKSNDKILTDIIEEAVHADNYTKLSKSFGIDKTLKGKTLGSSGKRYELTASNIYKEKSWANIQHMKT